MTLRNFRSRNFCRGIVAAAACTLALGTHADDIDIFTGGASPSKPNVLIMIDSSSNWSATLGNHSCMPPPLGSGVPANAAASNAKFGAEMCALYQVALSLNENIRLGLMLFNESGNNGAYIRFAIRDMNDANKNAYAQLVGNFVQQGTGTDNSGSNQPLGKSMFEVFKYFGGYTSPAHANDDVAGTPTDSTHFGPIAYQGGQANNPGTYRRDYNNNNSGSPNVATDNRGAERYGADASTAAFSNQGSNTYNLSPITDGCAKNFVIFIANGNPGTGGDSGTPDAVTLLANVGGNANQITSGGSVIHASTFDEWARFLHQTDVSSLPGRQSVITYTIGVWQPQANGLPSNSDQQMINLMKSAANVGGGKYFDATSAEQVKQAILSILDEVQAVNSVFVSASLPVSVNTQGTYLNQVYMGMFRPDGTGNPRWLGNLKQFKIDQDSTGQLYLADVADANIINPATGFISPSSKSFWTSASTFWTNSPSGTPSSASDLPDGEVVEKGGAAEQIRTAYAVSQDTRRVFTCPAGGCASGVLNYAFNAANISGASYQTLFGASSASELTALVNWVRGQDNASGTPASTGWVSAEGGPGWTTTVRPSVHGDVLHSRPVVLNYPTIGPFIFYGANDGTLRGVKGGRLTTDGREQWAFVAPEFYGKFKRLRSQSPLLQVPGTPAGIIPTPLPKDYFFDGSIGSYQSDDLLTEYIYVTARRGGRVMYAFDVSDPVNPKFMWKKTPTDLPEAPLAQTWSAPVAFKVKASADPVIMFGAGYDPGEDNTPPTNNNVGHGVYVLNAKTGAVIKFFHASQNSSDMAFSVPSDIAVLDTDFDTFADRAYVGDMGGYVWRMDIDDPNPANWKLFQLANLASGSATAPRKFFFRPDAVLSKNYDLVLIGSGDREKPLLTTTKDEFYMLQDTFVGKDASGMVPIVHTDLAPSGAAPGIQKGWYLTLNTAGEKVVNAPLSISGVTFFATNTPTPPAPGVCSNLGTALAYAVDLVTGGPVADRNGDGTVNATDISVKLIGGGLPPSPVGGVVQLDNGKLVDFVIGAGGSTTGGGGVASALAPFKSTPNIPRIRKKIYWNTNSDK